jgi:ribosomal subunit interface protein
MQLIIQGKNFEVTDRLQEYIEKKVGKLDRYLPTITEARMELSVESAKSAKDRQVAQLTVRSKGTGAKTATMGCSSQSWRRLSQGLGSRILALFGRNRLRACTGDGIIIQRS